MRFTVGGEQFEITREQVIAAMRHTAAESIQKHLVEVDGQMFPPKQVFATVTGRARQSFTTMEAQRVLGRLGFVCRRADITLAGQDTVGRSNSSVEQRVAALEAAVGTMQAAIAGLHSRIGR